ncbi:hypothetical protein [Dysgonomonas macrotermitis]|uniref:DUF3592 domain-containing protein n=1 Tax=Dysgonomonas macrotermitis TaxID=1346286 RepID=A0A1M5ASW1_9BACT|nr:hypothetical protein [Dysgonomonas macrotermitis]SHF33177.1 hypothetical protein SAMN05444362_105146 [Dysgonomonas macrotermitis]
MSLKRITLVILYIIGTIFIIGGISGFIYIEKEEEGYIPTTATVENVRRFEEKYPTKTLSGYVITIDYVIDDQIYETRFETSRSSMTKSDIIPIMYHTQNPFDIRRPGHERIICLISICIGFITVIINSFIIHSLVKKS